MSRAPSRRSRQLGTYVSVYLSQPAYDFIAAQCEEIGASMPVWIRERVIEACPPEIQAEIHALTKKSPPMPEDSLGDALAKIVDQNRQRVLDLDARGFLPTAICSVTRLPLRAVNHILSSKAPPKRSPK